MRVTHKTFECLQISIISNGNITSGPASNYLINAKSNSLRLTIFSPVCICYIQYLLPWIDYHSWMVSGGTIVVHCVLIAPPSWWESKLYKTVPDEWSVQMRCDRLLSVASHRYHESNRGVTGEIFLLVHQLLIEAHKQHINIPLRAVLFVALPRASVLLSSW